MSALVSTGNHLISDPTGVFVPSVGVDFHPLGFTPFGELIRVYVYTENPDVFCLKTFARLLSSHEPLIVGRMEFVTILEYGTKPDEVLALIPRNTDCLNLHDEKPNV